MANTLKCEMCGYYWKEEWEKYPSCHWVARAPGEEAPCEEDDYFEEDEYENDFVYRDSFEDELCKIAVYDDMLAYHHREMGC